MAAGGDVEKENPNPSGVVDADSSSTTTLDLRVMFTEASFMMPSIQQLFATSKMLALAALNTDESEGPLPPKTVLIPSHLRVDLLLLQDFRFSLLPRPRSLASL